MKTKISLIIAAITLAATSCLESDIEKDFDNMNYREEVNFAMPVGTVRMQIGRLIDEQLLKNFEDGDVYFDGRNENILTVRYKLTQEFEWSDDIVINDFDFSRESRFTIPNADIKWEDFEPGFGVRATHKRENEYFDIKTPPVTTDDENSFFTKVNLSQGTIRLTLDINDKVGFEYEDFIFSITIEGLKDENGDAYVANFDMETLTVESSLYGYTLYTVEGETPFDYIVKAEVNFTANVIAEIINQPPEGSFRIRGDFFNLDFYRLDGYFGAVAIEDNMTDNALETFLNDLKGINGNFGVKNANIEVEAVNSVGMPFMLNVASIYFADEDENPTNLLAPLNLVSTSPLPVPAATITEQTTGNIAPEVIPGLGSRTSMENITLNKNYPLLIFEYAGVGNPSNMPTQPNYVQNFMIKNSVANMNVTMTIPLDLMVEEYKDFFPINFKYKKLIGEDEELSKSFESFYLHVTVLESSQPFNGTMEIFAVHDKEDYSLKVDLATISIDKPGVYKISVDQNTLNRLWVEDVQHIIFSPSLMTRADGRVLGTSTLDISLAIEFKSNLPISIF